MGYMINQAVLNGNPQRLVFTHGVDMNASQCGIDEATINQSFTAWPYPLQPSFRICVQNCSETLTDARMALPIKTAPIGYYCLPDLPSINSFINQSRSLNMSIDGLENYESINRSANQALSMVGDIIIAWKPLVGSIGITLFLCLFWLVLINLFVRPIVWLLISSMIVAGAGGGYALLLYAKDIGESINQTVSQSISNEELMRGLGYTLIGFSALLILITLAIRKRINIAIQTIKQSSKTLQSIKSLVLFPMVPLLLGIMFIIAWVVASLYLYSVGEMILVQTPASVTHRFGTNQPTGNPAFSYEFQWDDNYQKWFLLHIFMLLWTVQCLVYLSFTVMAGAVSDRYFTPMTIDQQQAVIDLEMTKIARDQVINQTKQTKTIAVRPAGGAVTDDVIKDLIHPTRFPVSASFARVVRFHLGTIIACALLIAIIQMIRLIVTYIQNHTRNQQNRAQRALFACLQCCLKCIQTFVDKVNRNALIWTTIYGDGFCEAVRQSFSLIVNNMFRVAALNMVTSFVILLGELSIAIATTGIVLLILKRTEEYSSTIQSFFGVGIATFVLSILIASMFMTVFHACVDTTFFCFLVDCEVNEKSGVMLASQGLRDLVQSQSKQAEIQAKIQADKMVYTNQVHPAKPG